MSTYDKLAPFIPLALLVGVAATQIYRAEVFDLSPWKGGGFGMFSTLDGPGNRHVMIHLIERGLEGASRLPADLPKIPELQVLERRARAMPARDHAQLLADELARIPWEVDDASAPGEKARARRLPPAQQASDGRKAPRRVRLEAVEVSVWKLGFVESPGSTVVVKPEVIEMVLASTLEVAVPRASLAR